MIRIWCWIKDNQTIMRRLSTDATNYSVTLANQNRKRVYKCQVTRCKIYELQLKVCRAVCLKETCSNIT